MARKGKIENSKYREYIESQLLGGVSVRELEQDLKDNYGFDISHSALSTYHREKLGGVIEPENLEQFQDSNEPIPIIENDSVEHTLYELYKRQVKILEYKHREYQQGRAKFPINDLKALKDINVLLRTHTAKDQNGKMSLKELESNDDE